MSNENNWTYENVDTQPINIVADNQTVSEDSTITFAEAAAEDLGIKASKPKEVPTTDDNNVIASPATKKPGGAKKPSLSTDSNGVLSSKAGAKKDKPKVAPQPEIEKVAVFSTRNVTWNGVGKVYRGYNIVSVDEADKWLTRDHVRLATPEEIAEEFGQ